MIILLNIFKTFWGFTTTLDVDTETQNRKRLFCTNYPDIQFEINKFFDTLLLQ